MKILSALFTAASGSLGGITASHNKGGAYLRSRVIPTNPNSDEQQAVRASIGALANLFGSLTTIQRQSWEDWAAQVSFTDRLGAARKLSAINAFIHCNQVRNSLILPADIVLTAPTDYNNGATPVINSLTAAYSAPGQLTATLTVNIQDAPAVAVAGDWLLAFSSSPLSPGVHSFKGPFLFQGKDAVDTLATQPQAFIMNIPGNWNALGGDKVYIRCEVSRNDGRLSGAAISSCVTTAP